jgi:hypothetical protein
VTLLSLPRGTRGEGGRREAAVGWGLFLGNPHPDARFARVDPPRKGEG